jgi:predicted DNA-binding protein (MmcQ/YjbR family)
MNKELWITIILNDVSDDDIMELVRKSYDLTNAAKGRGDARQPDT